MNDELRIGWLSHHEEGYEPLRALLEEGAPIICAITLEGDALGSRSANVDYGPLCDQYRIPLYRIRNINDPQSVDLLKSIQLDVLMVIGWSQILRDEALGAVRLGCFGAHASLLPRNRGSAPINWALIRGDTRTGNTLIRLSPDVDAGDIVDQRSIEISLFDDVATLYRKVAATNLDMLRELLGALKRGDTIGHSQPETGEPVLPRRRPEHGRIDWRWSARKIYGFIRALTRPYPGAFSEIDGRTWVIWRAALMPLEDAVGEPGELLGPVVSHSDEACGIVVACANGAVIVHEIQAQDGQCYSGRALADMTFKDRIWSQAANELDIF